jgi:hypothetical protein
VTSINHDTLNWLYQYAINMHEETSFLTQETASRAAAQMNIAAEALDRPERWEAKPWAAEHWIEAGLVEGQHWNVVVKR